MRNREYTWPEIRRIAADWKAGKTVAVLAADHNRTMGGLFAMMNKHRDLFPRRPGTPGIRRIDREKAAALRGEGLSYSEIGRRLGATPTGIKRAIEDGPPYFDARRRLDDAEVVAARKSGMTMKAIAQQFKVSHVAIHKALKRAA